MNRRIFYVLVVATMSVAVSYFVLLLCILSVDSETPFAGCSIDINKDFLYEHPLVLNTTLNEFILPNSRNGLRFSVGEKLRLACPGIRNHVLIAGKNVQEVTATCISDDRFNVTGVGTVSFKELKCSSYPDPIAKKTGRQCAGTYTEIGIGFAVSTGFVQIITICFDELRKDSLYSTYELSSTIGSQQLHVPRPTDFDPANFYPNMPITSMYKRASEIRTFTKILKSVDLARQYISLTNDSFLSRGHLTAKADFPYGAQQRATFYYVNVAPQWQTFNGENWNILESSCRNFSSQRQLDLTVYTGVYGRATLPDVNNKPVELTLYLDKSNKPAVTVPEVYWKILYDPKSQRAIGFVGHNNPYETDVAKKKICKTTCQAKWVPWDATSIKDGYSYCCDVRELQSIIKYIPNIKVSGLLV